MTASNDLPRPGRSRAFILRLLGPLAMCASLTGCSSGEVVRPVFTLPDDPAYRLDTRSGARHADAGYLYDRFRVAGITVATWSGRWVLYTDGDYYVETDTAELRSLATRAGVAFDARPPVPRADRYANVVTLPLFLLVLVSGAVITYRKPATQAPPAPPPA